MESGTIVRWLKAEGDRVEKGEPLYELDTDKVTQEVEAEASGVLLKIAVAEGEVDVGTTIAVIGEEGEDGPSDRGRDAERPRKRRGGGLAGPAREEEREAVARRGRREAAAPADGDARRPRQGLAARAPDRARARDRARRAPGTGPEGRIVAEDVERAAS